MGWDGENDKTIYTVVINHEEQYSIWPDGREIPLGWKSIGKSGTKKDCMTYIEEVWTDIRPKSLRKTVADLQNQMRKGK